MPATGRTAEPAPEQDTVLDVFAFAGFTAAHTASTSHPGHWWHLWTSQGHYIGSTNRPELLGALTQQSH